MLDFIKNLFKSDYNETPTEVDYIPYIPENERCNICRGTGLKKFSTKAYTSNSRCDFCHGLGYKTDRQPQRPNAGCGSCW